MNYLEEFRNYLVAEKRSSKHTVTAYLTDIESFYAFLGSTGNPPAGAAEISHRDIREWIVFLLDDAEISVSSVNRKLSSLKAYFKYLRKQGYVEVNPTLKVISPKKQKRLPEFVDRQGMDKLFDEIEFEKSFEGYRDRLILQLLYHTGIRLSELIGIKLSDIDLNEGKLKILGKRNKERYVPITGELIQSLQDYCKWRDDKSIENVSDSLFLTSKGGEIYPSLVYAIVKTNLNLVTTIKKKSPHVIRHSFATHMLNNGADLHTIKELLGHASLAATQVYTHNTFEKIKKIYNQAHPRA
jgi:integrase/recombinase XerC